MRDAEERGAGRSSKARKREGAGSPASPASKPKRRGDAKAVASDTKPSVELSRATATRSPRKAEKTAHRSTSAPKEKKPTASDVDASLREGPAASGSSRVDAIMAAAAEMRDEIAAANPKTWWRSFKALLARKRPRMPYRRRLLTFSAILFAFLACYVMSFVSGSPIGAAVNSWSDSVMASASAVVCGILQAILGGDWSGRELALTRLLTLGPTSVVIVSAIASMIVTCAIALAWSCHEVKALANDGTSNFLAESESKPDRSSSSGKEPEKADLVAEDPLADRSDSAASAKENDRARDARRAKHALYDVN